MWPADSELWAEQLRGVKPAAEGASLCPPPATRHEKPTGWGRGAKLAQVPAVGTRPPVKQRATRTQR